MVLVPPALADLGDEAQPLATRAMATIPAVMFAETLMSINVALGRVAPRR